MSFSLNLSDSSFHLFGAFDLHNVNQRDVNLPQTQMAALAMKQQSYLL